MNEQVPGPQVFGNRFAGAAGPGDSRAGYDLCSCFDFAHVRVPAREVRFHRERQDTSAPGWLRLLALIEEAAAEGREVFSPLAGMSPGERRQVITLPSSVGKLTAVKRLVLYRSNLVRLPPEIGAMAALEVFEPYTSARLHWFPYELTRCRNLKSSTVSTRRIFGNFKYRPPFPRLQQGPVPPGGPDPRRWGGRLDHVVQRVRRARHRGGSPPGVAVGAGRDGRAAAPGERMLGRLPRSPAARGREAYPGSAFRGTWRRPARGARRLTAVLGAIAGRVSGGKPRRSAIHRLHHAR